VKVVLVRVDDRLIHGQVVVGWTRTVGATRIVVADDEAAADAMRQMLLRMAAPPGVQVSILPVEEAARQLAAGAFAGERVMVIVRSPVALVRMRELGFLFDEVNVGNVAMGPGRVRLTKEVAATPDELEAWKELDRAGVALVARWLPGGAAGDFNRAVRAHG
jgi:mannose/fructose/N-acetylgalactosamine-specific phosphotransferase system component IIB